MCKPCVSIQMHSMDFSTQLKSTAQTIAGALKFSVNGYFVLAMYTCKPYATSTTAIQLAQNTEKWEQAALLAKVDFSCIEKSVLCD